MLKHHFPVMASTCEKSKLHKGVNKLSTWINRTNALAEENTPAFDRDKFVGDAFEHLTEAIVVWGRSDKAINMVEIEPAEHDEPGIDFIGVAHDLKSVHTIQCKFRSNNQVDLTEGRDHIAMFPSVSLAKYNAQFMTIWTTANDLHRVLDEAWAGRVNVIGYEQIRKLVDKNDAFWQFYTADLMGRN